MIGRRDFLIGGATLLATSGSGFAALPVPVGNKLEFRVTRKDATIGTHELTFERSGDGLVVRVAVDLVVKFGPLPLYRYVHRATETWQGSTVVSIEAETNDDGTRFRVSGESSGGTL